MTASPSAPGGPIEAGVFNASSQAEDIALVRNQGLDVDDDMEPAPKHFPWVETPAADTLFEGQTQGWDVIDRRSVVAQNQNEPSLKNGWTPQSLSYIDIFLHSIPAKFSIIVLLPSTSRATKEADIDPLTYGDLLHYLGLWVFMSTCSVWKREDFWSVTPLDQEANVCPCRLGEFMSSRRFDAINRELRFTNTNPPP